MQAKLKRPEIKRRPLSDTALAGLEPEANGYRGLGRSGLYFCMDCDYLPADKVMFPRELQIPALPKWELSHYCLP